MIQFVHHSINKTVYNHSTRGGDLLLSLSVFRKLPSQGGLNSEQQSSEFISVKRELNKSKTHLR